MKIYSAPMQGVTGWPFRLTHRKHYGGVDRYYMPFISVHQTRAMKGGEKRDILPAHNVSGCMVPQLLPGKAEDTLAYVGMIRDAGYNEVSLNFGCPAKTVTTKGKGAGILEDPARLDEFLEHLFTGMEAYGLLRKADTSGLKVTVKTRIGMDDVSRIDELIRVYNRYPIAEVQVHARLGKDGYAGTPDMAAFRRFYEEIRHPVCYNGDIRNTEDYRKLAAEYPDLSAVMIGRGLVADSMLAEQIVSGGGHAGSSAVREPEKGQLSPERPAAATDEKERLVHFMDDLCSAWYEAYGNEYPALCRMMEVWDYLKSSFPGCDRLVRKIRKTRTLEAYRKPAEEIFRLDYRPGNDNGSYMV